MPHPDENPLDCNEHGTHVSGTAAGYGVNANGSTFTGNYANLTKPGLLDMKVGPGMAPAATLYGLKVFGCEGSTDAVIPALDWALDPNGDGDFSDHLDIINLSLGSDDAPADDPENAVIDELTSHGVLSVIAAGNAGDLTDTGGAPGNAVSSLGVASTVDAYQLRDGLKVNAPSAVAGIAAGQMSVAYDWPEQRSDARTGHRHRRHHPGRQRRRLPAVLGGRRGQGGRQGRLARVGRQRRHPTLRLGRSRGQRQDGRCDRRDLHLDDRTSSAPASPVTRPSRSSSCPRRAPTSCARRPRPGRST